MGEKFESKQASIGQQTKTNKYRKLRLIKGNLELANYFKLTIAQMKLINHTPNLTDR